STSPTWIPTTIPPASRRTEARERIPFLWNRNPLSIHLSAHILIGEPVSTSPEYAPGTGLPPARARCDRRLAEPFLAHRLAHQHADRRRMRAAAHAHQIDLAPELGLDDGQRAHAGMPDRMRRHEAEPEPRRDHGERPVVAVAPV